MKTIPFMLLFVVAACTQTQQSNAEADASPEPEPIEIGDNRLVDYAMEGLQAMSDQSSEAFVSRFTDDAVYIFNAGDTIKGKAAIQAYWQGRMDVIEAISFDNHLWLPVTVNESPDVPTGDWLLAWFKVDASYTSGGSMSQWIHTTYHFTANDEIDMIIQYLDRVPIMQAQNASN